MCSPNIHLAMVAGVLWGLFSVTVILVSSIFEEGATHCFLMLLCSISVANFSVKKLLAPRTPLFFNLHWSRSIVFCYTLSVYYFLFYTATGIIHSRLSYLIAAPRIGCDTSSHTMVIEIGEVEDCIITSS